MAWSLEPCALWCTRCSHSSTTTGPAYPRPASKIPGDARFARLTVSNQGIGPGAFLLRQDSMHRLLLALSLIASGCAIQPIAHERMPFPVAEYEALSTEGSATVRGQGFLRTRGAM